MNIRETQTPVIVPLASDGNAGMVSPGSMLSVDANGMMDVRRDMISAEMRGKSVEVLDAMPQSLGASDVGRVFRLRHDGDLYAVSLVDGALPDNVPADRIVISFDPPLPEVEGEYRFDSETNDMVIFRHVNRDLQFRSWFKTGGLDICTSDGMDTKVRANAVYLDRAHLTPEELRGKNEFVEYNQISGGKRHFARYSFPVSVPAAVLSNPSADVVGKAVELIGSMPALSESDEGRVFQWTGESSSEMTRGGIYRVGIRAEVREFPIESRISVDFDTTDTNPIVDSAKGEYLNDGRGMYSLKIGLGNYFLWYDGSYHFDFQAIGRSISIVSDGKGRANPIDVSHANSFNRGTDGNGNEYVFRLSNPVEKREVREVYLELINHPGGSSAGKADIRGIAVESISELPASWTESDEGRVFQWKGVETGSISPGVIYRVERRTRTESVPDVNRIVVSGASLPDGFYMSSWDGTYVNDGTGKYFFEKDHDVYLKYMNNLPYNGIPGYMLGAYETYDTWYESETASAAGRDETESAIDVGHLKNSGTFRFILPGAAPGGFSLSFEQAVEERTTVSFVPSPFNPPQGGVSYLQLVKPAGGMNLVIRQAGADGTLANSTAILDTRSSETDRAKVTAYLETGADGRWTACPADGFPPSYDGSPVSIDLMGVPSPSILYYAWSGADGTLSKWNSQRFPAVGGGSGRDGESSHLYVAYASDSSGNGFSLVPSDSLAYINTLVSSAKIANPSAGDFDNSRWVRYIGRDGKDGQGGGGEGGGGSEVSGRIRIVSNVNAVTWLERDIGTVAIQDSDGSIYRISNLGEPGPNESVDKFVLSFTPDIDKIYTGVYNRVNDSGRDSFSNGKTFLRAIKSGGPASFFKFYINANSSDISTLHTKDYQGNDYIYPSDVFTPYFMRKLNVFNMGDKEYEAIYDFNRIGPVPVHTSVSSNVEGLRMEVCTQSEYDAIAFKSPTVMYMIKEEK